MILLSDNEIVEGLLGGVGWVITMFEIKELLKSSGTSIYLISILTWAVLWYIRKLGMNLYRDYKTRYGIPDTSISIMSNSNMPILSFLLILVGLLLYFGTRDKM